MICVMHQAEQYGHLRVHGKPIATATLARMTGATPKEVAAWVGELEDAGVFDRDEDGGIYSRRMVRDEQVRRARAAGGKFGGNPNLQGAPSQRSEVTQKVGNKVNHPPNLRPTPSSSSSSSASSLRSESFPPSAGVDVARSPPTPDPPGRPVEQFGTRPDNGAAALPMQQHDPPGNPHGHSVYGLNGAPAGGPRALPDCPVEAVVDLYHEVLPELPRVERITPQRRASIRQRWREWAAEKRWNCCADGLDEWRNFFGYVRNSAFLMGKKTSREPDRKPFVATLEWLMKPANHVKVFEGHYHDG